MTDTISFAIRDLLCQWLERQLPPSAYLWMAEKMTTLEKNSSDHELCLSISLTLRKVGKDDLKLTPTDLKTAHQVRTGWNPKGWSVDQAARLTLLLSSNVTEKRFAEQLCILLNGADVGELVTFYRGLPLYPGQSAYIAYAIEGVRSNIKAVFESVAHHNPYPMEQFDERAWNQMVLKALFIGSSLHLIQGLDERCNMHLMRMLCDFAHERWRAGRTISPELWRCVGGYADQAALIDLRRALNGKNPLEREAAGLALSMCLAEEAKRILRSVPRLSSDIDSGRISWGNIFQKLKSY